MALRRNRAILGFVVGSWAAQLVAAPSYSIRALAVPDGTFYPRDINSSGVVVGDHISNGNSYVATADWAKLAAPSAPYPVRTAWRINDEGTVTGEAGSRYSYIASPGGLTLIPDSGIGTKYVQDMNNSGAIVGFYEQAPSEPGPRAFVYSGGTLLRLGTMGTESGVFGTAPSGRGFSIATAINDAGVVAGFAMAADGTYPAFVYRDGALSLIDLPDGFVTAFVRRIGNDGTIIGELTDVRYGSAVVPTKSLMFLHDGSGYTTVSSPDGRIMPLDINARGDVVGVYRYGAASGDPVPFMYRDGVLRNLNEMLEPGSGWVLTLVVGINDSGVIAGSGTYMGKPRAFVMTPLPEPGGWVVGFAVVTMRAIRRTKTKDD